MGQGLGTRVRPLIVMSNSELNDEFRITHFRDRDSDRNRNQDHDCDQDQSLPATDNSVLDCGAKKLLLTRQAAWQKITCIA